MSTNYGIDSLDQAVYDAAHDYVDPVTKEKGVPALASRMKIKSGTLQNKVNPTLPDHKLTTHELMDIVLHTEDYRPLYAFNQKFNHEAVYLGSYDDVSDKALIECLAKIDIERGEFFVELREALEQGQVTHDQYNSLLKEGMDVVRAWLETFERLKGMRTALMPVIDRDSKNNIS